jgi:hypothetical protein
MLFPDRLPSVHGPGESCPTARSRASQSVQDCGTWRSHLTGRCSLPDDPPYQILYIYSVTWALAFNSPAALVNTLRPNNHVQVQPMIHVNFRDGIPTGGLQSFAPSLLPGSVEYQRLHAVNHPQGMVPAPPLTTTDFLHAIPKSARNAYIVLAASPGPLCLGYP